jgi:aminoglycoside phosphotransferase family enzyme
MGFLSHADRGRRLAAASAELELNRRMAPDVYLGLADVVEGGELTDRMVVMRRLPEERRMSALVGTVEFPDHVRAVAKAVAAFHAAEAPANRTDMATRDAVARNWRDNLDVVRRQVALEPTTVAEVTRLADEYLAHRDALFAARIAGGFVRDGRRPLRHRLPGHGPAPPR